MQRGRCCRRLSEVEEGGFGAVILLSVMEESGGYYILPCTGINVPCMNSTLFILLLVGLLLVLRVNSLCLSTHKLISSFRSKLEHAEWVS